jgi:large repetitive protein
MKKGLIIFLVIAAVLIVGGIITYFAIDFFKTATLSSPLSIGMTNSSSPEFSFISDKAGTISYSGDCSSSTTTAVKGTNLIIFNRLADGTYDNCQIIVTNSAGKQSNLNVPSFTIDTTSPVTTVNTNYVNGTWVSSTTFNFSCYDSGSGCDGNTHYIINGGAEQRGNTLNLNTNGVYSIEYWNVDKAGNIETHHTEFSNVEIDTTNPLPVITTSEEYENQSFNISYIPTLASDNCYYEINSGSAQSYGSCSGIFSGVSLSNDGDYSIAVFENDSVGRIGTSNPVTIHWDTTPPTITITFPISGGTYDEHSWSNVVLGNDTDSVNCQYSSDQSTWYEFNSCSDTSNYNPTNSTSSQTLYVRGIDAAGNAGSGTSVAFTYYTT